MAKSKLLKLLTTVLAGSSSAPVVPEIAWLIQDEFADTLAAGAVNGTLATDGTNTRTVIDTNSKLSLANGVARLATGGAATGNPGLRYPQQTRVAGLLAIGQSVESGQGVEFGFDNGTTGNGQDALRIQATTWNALANGTSVQFDSASGSPVQDNQALALGASGCQFFTKVRGYWQLRFIGFAGNYNPYPYFGCIGGASIVDVNYYRMPENRFLAAPVVSDGFGSAWGSSDGTAQAALVADGYGAGGSGVAWTQQLGSWQNAAGLANASALDGGSSSAIATAPSGKTDVLLIVSLTRSGDECGAILRYTDANNYVRCVIDATNIYLIEVVAGTPNTLLNTTYTYSAGTRLFVSLEGQRWTVIYNNSYRGGGTNLNAALTGTAHGLYSTNTGNQFNDFMVYPKGTAGEYAELDDYSEQTDNYILAIGDSKTEGDAWVGLLVNDLNVAGADSKNWLELVPRYGQAGYTSTNMLTYVNANLANLVGTATHVLINLGVNDMTTMPASPSETTFKANIQGIIDACKTKWPSVKIYLAFPSKRSNASNAALVKTWLQALIALNANCFAGPDEQVWLENGDDFVTYTTDGIHYDTDAQQPCADEWLAAMGF